MKDNLTYYAISLKERKIVLEKQLEQEATVRATGSHASLRDSGYCSLRR